MKDWWKRRKSKTRKGKKSNGEYTILDFFLDVLFWIPELILFPLRLLFWLIRGLVRSIGDIF